MTFHSEYQLAIKIQEEYERDKKLRLHPKLCSFLRRFMKAADSHVELVDLVEEGKQLLEEIEEDGTRAE